MDVYALRGSFWYVNSTSVLKTIENKPGQGEKQTARAVQLQAFSVVEQGLSSTHQTLVLF